MAEELLLGQLLIRKGLLDEEQLAHALAEQDVVGPRLGGILVRQGALKEEALIRALAAQLKLPVARIRGKKANPAALDLVPPEVARKRRCLPLFLREEGGQSVLIVAMEDPRDSEALAEMADVSRREVRPVLVGPSELDAALESNYPTRPESQPEPEVQPGPEPDGDAPSPTEASETAPQFALPPVGMSSIPGPDDTAATAEVPRAALAPSPFGELGGDELEPGEAPEPADPGAQPVAEEPFGAFGSAGDFEQEPFGGFSEPAVREDTTQPEMGPEPRPGAGPADRRAESETLLQALAQLLVEKGVISREEFAERVRRLGSRSA